MTERPGKCSGRSTTCGANDRVPLLPRAGLALLLLALSPTEARVSDLAGFSVEVRVRTGESSDTFAAVAASKAWSGGEIHDYTSHHDLGRSRDTGTLAGWALYLQPNGAWGWNIGDGEHRLEYQPTVARQPLNDNRWHHLAFVVDRASEAAWLYYDGANVAVYGLTGLGDVVGRDIDGALPGADRLNGEIEGRSRHDWMMTGAEVAASAAAAGVPPPAWVTGGAPSAQAVSQIRVMAWNIWHGGRRDGEVEGIQRVVDTIREAEADIVCMQETYGSGARLADALGYTLYLRSSNLSVLSRFPIRAVHDLFQPFNFGGVTLELTPGQLIAAFSLWIHYLPDYGGQMRDAATEALPTADELVTAEMETRGAEAEAIVGALTPILTADSAGAGGIPVIVAGDFNSPSHLDWTEATRQRHRDLVVPWPASATMARAGFIDAFRSVHPDPQSHPGITWSPRWGEAWQDRIDYVYFTGDGVMCTAARVIDEHPVDWPSDHAAVLTTLVLPEPPGSDPRDTD